MIGKSRSYHNSYWMILARLTVETAGEAGQQAGSSPGAPSAIS
jgi:hypothetical protein